jgi:hypothetical protein
MKIYPLRGNPDSTVYVDVYDKPFDATIPYDVTFFELLNRVVQAEPWLTRDKVMIDFLKTIGIEKGKPFKPDEKTKRILADAAHEAHAVIAMKYEAGFVPPFFPGTHWAVPIPQETVEGMQTAFADPNSYAIDGRAAMYHMAYFSAKHLGAGQFYLLAIHDGTGQPLGGEKMYRLTVPANAPVKQYWSATAYDHETHGADSRDVALQPRVEQPRSAEKSRRLGDVYFGLKAPAGKESNWIPTNANGKFEVLFRFYGPEKPLFDKTWKLPDIEKVK